MEIRSYRKALGMTQAELAEKLGLAPNTLSQYETGKREPDMDTLSRLADALEVSVDELLGRERPNKTPSHGGELDEYLDMLANRSECRMLFSLAKDARREDVELAVRMIEALRDRDRGDVDA